MLCVLTVKTDKDKENVIQISAFPPANYHAAFIDTATFFTVECPISSSALGYIIQFLDLCLISIFFLMHTQVHKLKHPWVYGNKTQSVLIIFQ